MTDMAIDERIRRLRLVRDYITEHTDELDMATWRSTTECGTTMCFAGHAVNLLGPDGFEWFHVPGDFTGWTSGVRLPGMPEGEYVFADVVAQELLGLGDREAGRLFYSSNVTWATVLEEVIAGMWSDE